MAKILTQTAVEALKPGPARREVPDAKVPGLRIIVQPSGARSWALRYRFLDAPKKLTIGPYPAVSLADARKKAMEAHAEIARGNDPSAQKKAAKDAAKAAERQDDLIENVIAEYVERYAKARTRDWRETQRILNRDVSERWRGRRVDEIRKPDIIRMLNSIIARGAERGVNRIFALVRKFFRWCVERGLIDVSPCDGLRKPALERSRDRVLSNDELALLWRASEQLRFPYGEIIKLLTLSGARRDEIAGARWAKSTSTRSSSPSLRSEARTSERTLCRSRVRHSRSLRTCRELRAMIASLAAENPASRAGLP